MKPQERIVTSLPLDGLWTDGGPLKAERVRYLSAEELRTLLRMQRLSFVVADCGKPLNWITELSCYDFWKNEVRPHLADPAYFSLDEFPGGYCYVASEWAFESGERTILLEKHH